MRNFAVDYVELCVSNGLNQLYSRSPHRANFSTITSFD